MRRLIAHIELKPRWLVTTEGVKFVGWEQRVIDLKT